jgi:hypothetical protein
MFRLSAFRAWPVLKIMGTKNFMALPFLLAKQWTRRIVKNTKKDCF